jgi:hypothetical protein
LSWGWYVSLISSSSESAISRFHCSPQRLSSSTGLRRRLGLRGDRTGISGTDNSATGSGVDGETVWQKSGWTRNPGSGAEDGKEDLLPRGDRENILPMLLTADPNPDDRLRDDGLVSKMPDAPNVSVGDADNPSSRNAPDETGYPPDRYIGSRVGDGENRSALLGRWAPYMY